MKKKTSQAAKNVQPEITTQSEVSLTQWAAIAGIVIYLFIFPFQQALFNGFSFDFDASLLESGIMSAVMMILLAIFLFSIWRFNSHVEIVAIASLLIPIAYWLSSLQAVSSYYAKLTTIVALTAAAFLLFGLYLLNSQLKRAILETAVMGSAYMIVAYGFLNLFGQVYYPSALWLAHDGYRLTSVFQYSNTYAGYLGAILLAALYYTVHARSWYMRAVHAFMLVPLMLSFLLTYSRAAILILPVMFLIVLPFLKLGKQLLYIGYTLVAGVATLAILNKIAANMIAIADIVQPLEDRPAAPISIWESLPLQSWLIVIAVSAAVALLHLAIHRVADEKLVFWAERRFRAKWSIAAVPVAIIAIGAIGAVLLLSSSFIHRLLPEQLAERLQNINFQQHSVLERITFYKDGLQMSSDYPVLGAGGGAWQALYESYQNNPYWSRQAHSFFVQTLTEIGWVGLTIMIALFIYLYYLYIRAYIRHPEQRGSQLVFFIIATAMLAHSAFDFDMSYTYLLVLVFFCLGAMLAPYREQMRIAKFASFGESRVRWLFPAVAVVLGVIMLVWSYRHYDADRSYRYALHLAREGEKPLQELLPPLDRALAVAPDHPSYLLTKIDWMNQAFFITNDLAYRNEVRKLLDAAQLSDRFNRTILLAEYRYLKEEGNFAAMLDTLEFGLAHFQWDIRFYEVAIMEYFEIGEKEPDNKERYWSRALEIYDDVQRRIGMLDELPPEQKQGREFAMTPMMRQAVGQILFSGQDYRAASELLQPLADQDLSDAYVRSGVRYYLASLHALGQEDRQLYEKLIAADPEEASRIEALFAL